MNELRPLLLVAAGALLLLGGFAYDVLFAGIPFQDPTPEMSERYVRHASIADVIRRSGFVVCLLGGLAAVWRRVRRSEPPAP